MNSLSDSLPEQRLIPGKGISIKKSVLCYVEFKTISLRFSGLTLIHNTFRVYFLQLLQIGGMSHRSMKNLEVEVELRTEFRSALCPVAQSSVLCSFPRGVCRSSCQLGLLMEGGRRFAVCTVFFPPV